jgi:hypothetical protein
MNCGDMICCFWFTLVTYQKEKQMNFTERQVQYPKRVKLIKVDANNNPIPNEPEIFVNFAKEEGDVLVEGTPINSITLNILAALIENKSAVTVSGAKTDVSFSSDPQTQITEAKNLANAKITATDYATSSSGGTLKVRFDSVASTLYLTNNGTNA